MKKTNRVIRFIAVLIIVSLIIPVCILPSANVYAGSSVKYIAHRGLSSRAPENTLAAFRRAAIKDSFYGIEFDIWESSAGTKKDGSPLLLVMHDETTGRMCNINRKVRSIKASSLKKFTIDAGNNIKKYPGQKIPTAEQALNTIWKYSDTAVPVIELKHRLSSTALKYLLKYLGDHKAIVISFDLKAVVNTVKMAKHLGISDNIYTMYLRSSLSSSKYTTVIKKLKKYNIDCISMKYSAVSAKTVKRFHKSGIDVGVWTVNSASTAKKYKKMGVDYITSNKALF